MTASRSLEPKDIRTAPGPDGRWLIGSLTDLLFNEPFDLVYRYTREYGDFLQFKILHRSVVVANRPEFIQPVVEDWETFHKGIPNPAVQPITGGSIFSINRPEWESGRTHHPYAQDYASAAFAGMVPAMVAVTRERLRAMATDGENRDLYPALARMTYDVFCTNVLGRIPDEVMYAYYSRIIREVTFRVKTQGITIDPWFWGKLRGWNDGIAAVIEAQRGEQAESTPVDALGVVLEHGTELSPELLRDEISLMIIGGVGGVSTALSSALDNLCRYPEEGQRVIDEVRAFVGAKGGQPITLDEVNGLEHLDRFADESIRLAPPVHIISRAVKPGETAVVNGYELAAKTEVVFAPFAVHRNPALWEEPLAFRPDRFLDEPQPYTFMPFGVGERTCIGRSYARMCIRVMLAVLLSEFDLSIDTSRPMGYKSGPLIIVPKNPLTGNVSVA